MSDEKRRRWTDDDRATVGRERRLHSPPQGVPIEAFEDEDVTGQYEGPDLDAMRDRRPTPYRLRHLERKHDKLATDVAEMKGDMKAHGSILSELHNDMTLRRADEADAKKHARERVTKAIGAVFGLITSGAVLHWIVGKL